MSEIALNIAAPKSAKLDAPKPQTQSQFALAQIRARFANLQRFVPALVPLSILLVWQLASNAGTLSASILPAPSHVASAFWRLLLSGELIENALVSFGRAISGLLVGGPEFRFPFRPEPLLASQKPNRAP